jgi:hypothetical protein
MKMLGSRLIDHLFHEVLNLEQRPKDATGMVSQPSVFHIRSRFLGALRIMLSTLNSSSAASDADETTARLSL